MYEETTWTAVAFNVANAPAETWRPRFIKAEKNFSNSKLSVALCLPAYKNLVQLFSLVPDEDIRQMYKKWNGKCRRRKRGVVAGIETANDGRELVQYLMWSDRDDAIRYRELPTGLGVRPILALVSCQSVSMPAKVQWRVPNCRLTVRTSTTDCWHRRRLFLHDKYEICLYAYLYSSSIISFPKLNLYEKLNSEIRQAMYV